MVIDNTGSIFFDKSFGRYLSQMYSGIEFTMKNESVHSCALLLSTYTEVLGGFVTGKLKDSNEMRNNYVTFLEYLGGHYIALHEKYDLYKNVRHKLVHEFNPRPNYVIWLSEFPTQGKFGVEIIHGNLNFNLREYYRDFKCGVDKFRDEFNFNPIRIINSTKVITPQFDNLFLKPKYK